MSDLAVLAFLAVAFALLAGLAWVCEAVRA